MAHRTSRFFSTLLIVAVLAGAGYWYWHRVADATCPAPIAYAIGAVDKRFGLSEADARAVVGEAEALWESTTGRDLFVYDPDAAHSINFIFDERQKLTVEEHRLRDILNRREDVGSAIKEEYEQLLAKYEILKQTYASKVEAYENRLAKHNGEVAYWNNQGGAPEEVYDRLNDEQRALDAENKALGALTGTLNELVDAINTLGEKGNKTVEDYNDRVAEYNDRFNREREFTEGEYYNGSINIYQFKNLDELRLVLAHELGHALSLEHVDDSASIMYYLMDKQARDDVMLSSADLTEFERICGK